MGSLWIHCIAKLWPKSDNMGMMVQLEVIPRRQEDDADCQPLSIYGRFRSLPIRLCIFKQGYGLKDEWWQLTGGTGALFGVEVLRRWRQVLVSKGCQLRNKETPDHQGRRFEAMRPTWNKG